MSDLTPTCNNFNCRVVIPRLSERIAELNGDVQDLRKDLTRAEDVLEWLGEHCEWGPGAIRGAVDAYFFHEDESKADFYEGDPGDESDYQA